MILFQTGFDGFIQQDQKMEDKEKIENTVKIPRKSFVKIENVSYSHEYHKIVLKSLKQLAEDGDITRGSLKCSHFRSDANEMFHIADEHIQFHEKSAFTDSTNTEDDIGTSEILQIEGDPLELKEKILMESEYFKYKPSMLKQYLPGNKHFISCQDPTLPEGFKVFELPRKENNRKDKEYLTPDKFFVLRSKTACLEYAKFLEKCKGNNRVQVNTNKKQDSKQMNSKSNKTKIYDYFDSIERGASTKKSNDIQIKSTKRNMHDYFKPNNQSETTNSDHPESENESSVDEYSEVDDSFDDEDYVVPGQQLSDDESSNSSEPERSILVENSEAENDHKNVSSKSLAENNFINASQKYESSLIDDESSMDDWSEEETVGDDRGKLDIGTNIHYMVSETYNQYDNGSVSRCPKCPKEYESTIPSWRINNLKRHFLSTHTNLRFKCTKCSKTFRTSTCLKTHTQIVHEGKTHPCPMCGKRFRGSSHVKRHISSVHDHMTYKCTECDKKFTSKGSLKVHMEAAHEKIRYMCSHCDKHYFDKENLKAHIKVKHEGLRFKCNQCDKEYSRRVELNRHIECHHKGGGFNCEICNKKFSRKDQVRIHIKEFHEKIRYPCNQCEKDFGRKRSLKEHVRFVHEKNERFKCPYCAKNHLNRTSLDYHIKAKHNMKAKKIWLNLMSDDIDRKFKCNDCDKTYATKFLLIDHVRAAHEGKGYKCKKCLKIFTRLDQLETHMKAVHEGVKFECKICGKKFSQNSGLYTHMKIHDGRKFPCPHCDHQATQKGNLKLHIIRSHAEKLPD